MAKLTTSLVLLVACAASCGAPTKAAPPIAEAESAPPSSDWVVATGRAAQVYGNEAGVRLTVVPIESRSGMSLKYDHLLRATGTQSRFDGLVVPAHRRHFIGRGRPPVIDYDTQLHGAPSVFAHSSDASSLELAGYEPKGIPEVLFPLEEAVDAAVILRLYQEQRSRLQELSPTDRAGQELAQSARLKELVSRMGGACGAIPVSIDWSTVQDQWFEEFAIAQSCAPPIFALREFCDLFPHKAEFLRDNVSLSCAFRGVPADSKGYTLSQGPGNHLVYSPGTVSDGNGHVELLQELREVFGEQERLLRHGEQSFIIKYAEQEATIYHQAGQDPKYYPVATASNVDDGGVVLPAGARTATLFRVRESSAWILQCDYHEDRALQSVVGAERQLALDRASFAEQPKWQREPYFLARDTRGTYYYIDRLKAQFGGKGYRVFVGRKGQSKLTRLESLVEDNEGAIFSTASGALRLILYRGDKSAFWIRGKNSTALTPVDIRASNKLIYDELGVYYGVDLGLACE